MANDAAADLPADDKTDVRGREIGTGSAVVHDHRFASRSATVAQYRGELGRAAHPGRAWQHGQPAVKIMRRARDAPCGGALREWRVPRANAFATESRASWHVVDYSAGRSACSRSGSTESIRCHSSEVPLPEHHDAQRNDQSLASRCARMPSGQRESRTLLRYGSRQGAVKPMISGRLRINVADLNDN
jgi:hypothetical protein